MAANTYVALKTTTLGTTASSVTLDTIPQGYTDLVLVISAKDNRGAGALGDSVGVTFNSDTSTGSTNYSFTYLFGYGSSVSSGRSSNAREIDIYSVGTTDASSAWGVIVANIQNYSNATTYKTVLAKGGVSTNSANINVGTWRSTAAITSITLWPGYNGSGYTFSAGSTFTIYGIASVAASAKATGGNLITSDADYYYHVFTGNGTFTPLQSLTADVLVVAGGGGGGMDQGGGGGAGGLLGYTSQSLTATGYTCTVGAGGTATSSGGTAGGKGGDSSFGGLTAALGGGGGNSYAAQGSTSSNGSGGGGSVGGGAYPNGNAATSGQGYAGGNGTAGFGGGAGGGGASAVGANKPTGSAGAAGGVGSNTYSSWGLATGTGENVGGTYYYAGGGGGSTRDNGTLGAGGYGGGGTGGDLRHIQPTAGTANTGGGGGAADLDGPSKAGGSGIVIVRYAK